MKLWNFYFEIFEKAVGKEEAIVFLSPLLRYLGSPLLVVWDRLPAHRSRLVGEFLDSPGGLIAIEYLPPYAPELNPVEGLWDQVQDCTCNRRHADLDELETTLTQALRPFWEKPSKVLSLIHHWLHAQANAMP